MKKPTKKRTLKEVITSFMPAATIKINNRTDPTSAYSMMKRATAAKKKPTKKQLKSYRQAL